MAKLVKMPRSTRPDPKPAVDSQYQDKYDLATARLGRVPQCARDGRIEGVDYNVPASRKCRTEGCSNLRRSKGLKRTNKARKRFFPYCTKCLRLSREHKTTSTLAV